MMVRRQEGTVVGKWFPFHLSSYAEVCIWCKGFLGFPGLLKFHISQESPRLCWVQFFIEKGEIRGVMSSTCPYVAVEWCAVHKKFIYHRNMAGVGRNLKDHLIPIWASSNSNLASNSNGHGCHLLDQVAQGPIQPSYRNPWAGLKRLMLVIFKLLSTGIGELMCTQTETKIASWV